MKGNKTQPIPFQRDELKWVLENLKSDNKHTSKFSHTMSRFKQCDSLVECDSEPNKTKEFTPQMILDSGDSSEMLSNLSEKDIIQKVVQEDKIFKVMSVKFFEKTLTKIFSKPNRHSFLKIKNDFLDPHHSVLWSKVEKGVGVIERVVDGKMYEVLDCFKTWNDQKIVFFENDEEESDFAYVDGEAFIEKRRKEEVERTDSLWNLKQVLEKWVIEEAYGCPLSANVFEDVTTLIRKIDFNSFEDKENIETIPQTTSTAPTTTQPNPLQKKVPPPPPLIKKSAPPPPPPLMKKGIPPPPSLIKKSR
jgi:hypothetical protein